MIGQNMLKSEWGNVANAREISQMSKVRILNKCEIPLRPPGKDVALPGTEEKMGVIQGGAAQIKITEVRQAIRL